MNSFKYIVAIILSISIAFLCGLAGSDGGLKFKGVPLFFIGGGIIFLLHIAVFIPSYIAKTEHYFDLTGSLSYIATICYAWLLSPVDLDLPKVIIGLLVIIWAVRLGSFLFLRVKKVGKDIRFDELKTNLLAFSMVWVLSGLWVYITISAALAAITSSKVIELKSLFFVGLSIWAFGFIIESVADIQKYKFKLDHKNQDRFITHGLWAWSRHPNYFGEIVLWLGIATMSYPALTGFQYITLLSPLFVYFLLTKISGIPMLEAKARSKWGDNTAYTTYKESTPVLFPKSPHR